MNLTQQSGHNAEDDLRLDSEAQRRVIARAVRLQEQRQDGLTVDQLADAAREAGLDPALVREAAALEGEARRASREHRRRLWMSSPALLSLLSLGALPTHDGVWCVWLCALAFTAFLAPADAEAPADPGESGMTHSPESP